MEIKEIKTLKMYSSYIENALNGTSENTLWFRGCGDSEYSLTPSIHRHPTIKGGRELIDLEQKIIYRFKQRAIPFLEKPINIENQWELIFLMQHFGSPTRLLDWSENPYIALYFALTSAKYKRNGRKIEFNADATVWFLDPNLWNKEVLKDVGYDGGIISLESPHIKSYEPFIELPLMKEKPIAIYGTHNSKRIVAQRGVFTIFGKGTKSMEQIFEDEKYPNKTLVKVIIPKDSIEPVLKSLIAIGITDSVVFPDLDGLSKEIKRFVKFDI